MKRLFLIIVLCLLLAGCASTTETTDTAKPDPGDTNVTEGPAPASEEPFAEEEKPPIFIEELPLTVTILPPDGIGTVWMEATYVNNSDVPVVGFSATVLLKDTNEKTYLHTYDTVLRGETSPSFETFGPSTGRFEDFEILEYSFTIIGDNNEEVYVDYDCKLGRYSWF